MPVFFFPGYIGLHSVTTVNVVVLHLVSHDERHEGQVSFLLNGSSSRLFRTFHSFTLWNKDRTRSKGWNERHIISILLHA